MSYENAPATRLLATHCAVCGRPLLDAKSVELGIGPDCREKYGYNAPALDAARPEANKLVHAIAQNQGTSPDQLAANLSALSALGFGKVSERILKRLVKVQVLETKGGYAVKAPYSEAFADDIRRISGRRWDKDLKVNLIPSAGKNLLWTILQRHFKGMLGASSRGFFIVGIRALPVPAVPVLGMPAQAKLPLNPHVAAAARAVPAFAEALAAKAQTHTFIVHDEKPFHAPTGNCGGCEHCDGEGFCVVKPEEKPEGLTVQQRLAAMNGAVR